jgi:hypothetical protein
VKKGEENKYPAYQKKITSVLEYKMLQEIEKLETNVKLPSYDITHPYFNVLDDIVDYTKALSNDR